MKKFENPVVELISLQETDKIMYTYDYGWELLAISDPDPLA